MKKTVIISIIVVAVLGLVAWGVVASRKSAPLATVKASRGDVTETVLVTGTTAPSQSVDLSFERTGKVSAVYVSIGDAVKAGQPLVEMDRSDLLAQLAQSQAAVESAKAQLDSLKAGTRPEQIAVQEVRVANAQVSVEQAAKSLSDAIVDAKAKSEDALHAKTNDVFTNPQGVPVLNFTSNNPQYENDLVNGKPQIERALAAWDLSLIGLSSDSDLLKYSSDAKKYLAQFAAFLDEMVAALNVSVPSPNLPSAPIATYKTNAAAARAQVGAAISALGAAETGYSSAQANLALEKNNLDLQKAGSTAQQIAAQQAAVTQAQAGVQAIQVQLAKTTLRSPIDGVITVQNAKLGQIVTVTTSAVANSSLISIISLNKLEIDANIPEVNISRISLGQAVKITFDAIPGESFKGSVMEIDPAETVISGVVNYKIKVALVDSDTRFKSGLTANLSIETATKKDVVLLPQYAILQNDQGVFARIPDGKATKDVPVKLGIRGSDGMVEIVSGLEAGQEVVNVGLKTK